MKHNTQQKHSSAKAKPALDDTMSVRSIYRPVKADFERFMELESGLSASGQ